MIATPVDAELSDIEQKVANHERLTLDDGIHLFHTRDVHTLGAMANQVRERFHGRRTYYNFNRHVNYSNYCVLRCKFCSFYTPYVKQSPANTGRGNGDGDGNRNIALLGESAANDGVQAYELTIDDIVARAAESYDRGATEIHIVGGLHPKLPFSYYTDLCRAIRTRCPRMHIKAFTAIEIIHFTRIAQPRLSVREVLEQLGDAGLDSMPGGGAEIFDDRVHDEAYKNKVGETEWFEVHRTAHEIGIFTNATMLYGHVESPADRVRHMIKLRDHQDESIRSRPARFNCFIPLSFIPDDSEFAHLPGPTGLDDLRTLAVSRLMLDNFDHIKAFWIMQTPKLAQVSLNWGVDDIDGTVVYYDITKRQGQSPTDTHQEMSVDQLKRLIREAGGVPVERDSLYRRVVRENGDWRVCDAAP